MNKPDLTLINELIKALNQAQILSDKVRETMGENRQAYTVELAKALGLVSTIKMEADLLTLDYSKLIKTTTSPSFTAAAAGVGEVEEFLSLLGPTKAAKN